MPDRKSLPLAQLDLARFGPERVALFLDFDGTLAHIVDHPDDVFISHETKHVLDQLKDRLNGALAIISGRSIENIEQYVGRDIPCIAGVHGLQRRDSAGRRHDTKVEMAKVLRLADELETHTSGHPNLHIERKPASVALHYRQHPELKEFCNQLARRLAAKTPGSEVLEGKMVVEIKLDSTDKGDAVLAFMAEAPFSGRVPVYAGDDVTDNHAFRAIRPLRGITIRVGDVPLDADYCASDTDQFLGWLACTSQALEAPPEGSNRELAGS
jgi:trehalose 6-phosphate phosphatase